MINVTIVGKEEVIAKLTALTPRIREELVKSTRGLTLMLTAYVKDQKLSGQVLKNQSGTLRRSIHASDVLQSLTSISATVGTNVEYAAIHEYGGNTEPHIIEPRNVAALHFMMNGKDVFCKRVNHPGSKIPERSFLRSALADMKGDIQHEYKAAIVRAVK
jgi:phage gpG-like protein